MPTEDIERDEPPPFLRTWARVYTIVVIYLAFLIAVLAIGSRLLGP